MQQPRSKRRTKSVDHADWERHKDRIIQLWTDPKENLSVDRLRIIMKAETGFDATNHQYSHRLKNIWKKRKYFKKEELRSVNQVFQERTSKGKLSRVKLAGTSIHDGNIRRRHSRVFMTTMDRMKLRQAALNDRNLGIQLEGQDIVVETPSDAGGNSPTPSLELGELESIDRVATDSDGGDNSDSLLARNISTDLTSWNKATDMTEIASCKDMTLFYSGTNTCPYSLNISDSEMNSFDHEYSEVGYQVGDTDEEFVEIVAHGIQLLKSDELPKTGDASECMPPEANRYIYEDGEDCDIKGGSKCERDSQLNRLASSREGGIFLLHYVTSFARASEISTREAADLLDLMIESEGLYEPLPYSHYKKLLKSQISPFDAEEHNLTFSLDPSLTRLEIIQRSFQGMQQYLDIMCTNRSFHREFNEMVMHSPRFICQYGIYHFTTGHLLHQLSQSIILMEPGHGVGHGPRPPSLDLAQSADEKAKMADHLLGVDGMRGMLGFFGAGDKSVRSYEDYLESFPISIVVRRLQADYQIYLYQYGAFHPRRVFAYCKLASIKIRVPVFYEVGKRMTDGIEAMVSQSILAHRDGQSRRRIMMGLNIVGAALGDVGNHRLAIHFLKKAASLSEDEKDRFGLGAIVRFRLGRCYYKAERYTESLETLFSSAHTFKSLGFDNQLALVVFQVCKAISKRSHPLYRCVLPQLLTIGKFDTQESGEIDFDVIGLPTDFRDDAFGEMERYIDSLSNASQATRVSYANQLDDSLFSYPRNLEHPRSSEGAFFCCGSQAFYSQSSNFDAGFISAVWGIANAKS